MARIFVLCLCVFLIGCFADNSLERVKRAPGRNCPRFTNFNGKPVKYRRNGTRATFRCKKGFTRYGNKAVNCRSDNTWTGEPPVCIKANCVPKDIRHLDKLDMTELYGGALLTFSCEDNYKLIGITEIYCNGKVWNADPPVCKAPQQLLECDFENDLCGWSQDDSDDLDWIRNQGQTSTGGTGPRTDHTLQTTAGHYMFVESSNPAKNGDVARLGSPLYPTNMGNMCFEFWYHILGPDDQGHVGTLEVYVIGESEFVEDLQPVFVKDGNQGDEWRRGEIYIDQTDEPYQIVIAAVRKLSYISDIAIDDVRLYNCSGLSTTTVAQSTSTTMSTTLPTTSSTSLKSSPPQSTTPKGTSTAPSVSTIKSSSVSATTASTTLAISTSTASPWSSTVSVSTTGGVSSTSGSSTEPSTSSVNTPTTIETTTETPTMPTTKSTMTTQVLTTTRPSTSKPTTSTTLTTTTSTVAATSTIPSSSTMIASFKKTPTAAPTTEMSSTATTSKDVVTTTRKTTSISSTLASTSSTPTVKSKSVNPDTPSSTEASTPMTYTKRTKPTKITKSKPTRRVKPTKPTKPTRKVKPTKLTKPTRKVKPTKPVIRAKPTKRPTKKGSRTTSPTKLTTEHLISTSTVSDNNAETTESVVKALTTSKHNDTEIKISIAEQRSQHPDDETLKPLMIGLGVGIFCGLIIIGVVAWICVRRKKFYTRGYEDELKPITKSSSNDNFTGIQYEYHDDEYEQ